MFERIKVNELPELPAQAQGVRVRLSSGEMSPVLCSLLSSLPSSFVGALSYDQIVVLNGAAAKLVQTERLRPFDLLCQFHPGLIPDLYSSLIPWILVNAFELRHKATFGLFMRILLVLDMGAPAVTSEQLRNRLGLKSVFIATCQMRKAGIIDKSFKVRTGHKSHIGFKLTDKGQKLLNLALKAAERRESLLFQNLAL